MQTVRLVVVLAVAAGCTKVQYTRTGGTHRVIGEPQPQFDSMGNQTGEIEPVSEYDFDTNEVLLVDQTGVACAALMTEIEKTGNAYEAAHKAQRESLTGEVHGPVKYSYRVYNPAEYRGIECGGYYKWGSASPRMLDGVLTEAPELWEVGLSVGGMEPAAEGRIPWLRKSIFMRAGAGHYEYEGGDASGVYITLPLKFGLHAFPEFLYGLGVSVHGGFDMLSWLADAGGVLRQIDYGAALEYGFGWKYVALGASAGWERTNVARGELWVQPSAFAARAFVQVHLDELF